MSTIPPRWMAQPMVEYTEAEPAPPAPAGLPILLVAYRPVGGESAGVRSVLVERYHSWLEALTDRDHMRRIGFKPAWRVRVKPRPALGAAS